MSIRSGTIPNVTRALAIIAGAILAAVGLEAFLVPNQLIDGGIVGVSIISATLSGLPVGLFLFLLNLPFIYLGYHKLGKQFAISSMFGIIVLATATFVLHNMPTATVDPILAAIYGGAIVGAGVGLVIRYGGTLDGTEIIAILIDRRSPFSVGEIIMFMNLFIIGSAGFVFGWDKAMYSLIAYFVAFKVIDITVEGLDESKSVWIVSKRYKQIGQEIYDELGRTVTHINTKHEPSINAEGMILVVITRIEEQRLKAVVYKYDPGALVIISSVHEVMGKDFQARQNSKA